MPFILVAIAIYALANSLALFKTWGNTPIEKFSSIPFVLWLSPIFYFLFKKSSVENNYSLGNVVLAFLALAMVIFSSLSSLNSAAYMGLAFSFVSLIPWSKKNILWLVSSVSWMPALGWVFLHFFPTSYTPLFTLSRLFLALFGVLALYNARIEK